MARAVAAANILAASGEIIWAAASTDSKIKRGVPLEGCPASVCTPRPLCLNRQNETLLKVPDCPYNNLAGDNLSLGGR